MTKQQLEGAVMASYDLLIALRQSGKFSKKACRYMGQLLEEIGKERAQLAAAPENLGASRERKMREVLESIRIRAAFIGHPGERFYDRGDGVMSPDWRDELQALEAVLREPCPPDSRDAALREAIEQLREGIAESRNEPDWHVAVIRQSMERAVKKLEEIL